MRKLKGYKAIRAAMRRNELEVLAYLRKGNQLVWPSNAWYGAISRLEDAGMIVWKLRPFGKTQWRVRKGARPVTGAVRA